MTGSVGEERSNMNNDTVTNGGRNGSHAEELASLRQLLAQVESDTNDEHARERQVFADALRSVIEKYE